MYRLPRKLSELATIALDDVVALEQHPNFEIDMGTFLRRGDFGPCAVCAAGAVMVKRLLDSPFSETSIVAAEFVARFGAENARALEAIEYLRSGTVGAALAVLEGRAEWGNAVEDNEHDLDRDLPMYAEGAAWHEAMQVLIDDLTEAGL